MSTAPNGIPRLCKFPFSDSATQLLTLQFRNIMTNDQKKEWFLRLNPNGRIPVIIDNHQSPPFCVMETSAQLLYLEKFADKDNVFGFKDDLERSECLQWLFFWHGSGAPYQGQTNHFGKFAKEKIPCKSSLLCNTTEAGFRDMANTLLEKTPLSASGTKLCEFTACLRSNCPANTPVSPRSILPGKVRESTALPTLEHGHG